MLHFYITLNYKFETPRKTVFSDMNDRINFYERQTFIETLK